MNDKTPTTLDRLLNDIPVGNPPIGDLLAAGHAAKRRQRRTVIAGTVAATVLIIGGGAVATQVVNPTSDTNHQNMTAAQALDSPPGTRLVGLGRVVVAVPDGWAANYASCNTPIRDTYYFPYPQDCQSGIHPDVSSIAISTTENAEATPVVFDLQRDGTVDGYDVRSSGLICTPGQGESCYETFGIPDLDTWFTVRVPRSDNATDTIEAIRDSLRVLPEDYTTVPFIPYGTEQQVTTAMREAGLTTEIEYTTCPATADCVTGVSDITPAVGTALPADSTVTITVLRADQPKAQDDTLVGPNRGLAVGETGPMSLWLHCGLEYVKVGDRVWQTEARGDVGPPPGWPEQLPGTATRTSEDTITFISDLIDEQIIFRPYEPTTPGGDPNAYPEEAICY